MRKYLLIIFSGFYFQSYAQQTESANCNPPTTASDLDIANVRTKILTAGNMWDDPLGIFNYEIPKNSGKNSMYAGGIWIGGMDDNGNVRVAAQTYRQQGNDFWPGPISMSTVDVSPSTCIQYDRHWRLDRSEVEYFTSGGSASQTIIDYPGNGNISLDQTPLLAPFVDVNADGVYNYLDGDYPMFDNASSQSGCGCSALHGDQVLWWVINDVGNVHTSSNSPIALGLEIQCQAFAFASADDNIRNSTFYEYKIINRNITTDMNETWFGFWADADLGNYIDDYVGCDVERGLAYTYNGDNNDEGIGGYGINPPAIGVDFIFGPAADTSDLIDNDRDSCIDCTFLKDTSGVITDTIPDHVLPEHFVMSRFVYYDNSLDPVSGNPVTAEDYYNYLRGYWRNGSKMTYGGNGNGGGSGATNYWTDFMYPGNSDPYGWGTSGSPMTNWDELIVGNVPGDRRFLTSVGPYTMRPGQVQCIQTAVMWARDTAGPLSSVAKLKLVDDEIKNGNNGCLNFSIGINKIEHLNATVYPIPSVDYFTVAFGKYLTGTTISVYDLEGKLIAVKNFSGDHVRISCTDYLPGIYFYRVMQNKNLIATGKVLKN
jgi:hypothetical protein